MMLISLAMDLAEKKLRDGTASNALIRHYLELGSTSTELRKEKLESEIGLINAKAKNIEDYAKLEEKYDQAMAAMREYNGEEFIEDDY